MKQLPLTPLIESPGMFDPLEAWEEFLTKVQAMPETMLSAQIIQDAKEMIEMKKQEAEQG